MAETLANQQIIITGGASGIGLATARLLAAQGAQLTLWDVNEAGLEAAEVELGVKTAVIDITHPDAVLAGINSVTANGRSLRAIIHAAGILRTGLFETIPLEEHGRLIDINLYGTVVVTKQGLPALKEGRGSLILFSSTSSFYGPPTYSSYGATKAAVLGLGQALRLELEEAGVHVGVVAPFFTDTPMINDIQPNNSLFTRFGVGHTADEVAAAVVRGVARRRFMIWPSANPFFFHWLSHVAYPINHHLMRFFWRSR